MTDERARELLTRERRRIERSLAVATGEREAEDELSTVDQHPADYATELYDREMDESAVEHLREELDAIDRAFKRIEQGTYGLSIESGRPIPDERLELIPWAERTTEEQAHFERAATRRDGRSTPAAGAGRAAAGSTRRPA
jgi:DnaK suppressor protein